MKKRPGKQIRNWQNDASLSPSIKKPVYDAKKCNILNEDKKYNQLFKMRKKEDEPFKTHPLVTASMMMAMYASMNIVAFIFFSSFRFILSLRNMFISRRHRRKKYPALKKRR